MSPSVSLFDDDLLQPYKCNKKWVVSMTPLPHNGSGSLIEGDGACHVCKRKLTDPDRYRFCSIACKVRTTRKNCINDVSALTIYIRSYVVVYIWSYYILCLVTNNSLWSLLNHFKLLLYRISDATIMTTHGNSIFFSVFT